MASKLTRSNPRIGVVHSYEDKASVGVLVEVRCEKRSLTRQTNFKTFLRNLCQHIATKNPKYMVRSQIPEEELIQEKAATRVRMQHKSEEAVERLVAKRVEAYSAAVCLLEQPLRKHDGKTVQEVLTELQTEAGQKVTIHRFVRYRLGDS